MPAVSDYSSTRRLRGRKTVWGGVSGNLAVGLFKRPTSKVKTSKGKGEGREEEVEGAI